VTIHYQVASKIALVTGASSGLGTAPLSSVKLVGGQRQAE